MIDRSAAGPEESPLSLKSRTREDLLILTPTDSRLDAQAAIGFRDAFSQAVGGHTGPVGLDLGGVKFMDSSGLGAVVASFKQLGAGRTLVIFQATAPVRKLFQMTRIDRVLPLVETEDEALARSRA
jgi:anti-sigma B factor antagonist